MLTIKVPIGHQDLRDIRSSYTKREINEEHDPAKQRVRDAVGRHFLAFHPGNEPMRLFSFPGVAWRFERQLMAAHTGAIRFIGIERTWAILEHGLIYMPGFRRLQTTIHLKSGNLYGIDSENALVLHADLLSLLGIGRKEKGGKSLRRKYHRMVKLWTAAWLDFCSQITDDVLNCLCRLSAFIDSAKNEVPIAVSVMRARDDFSSTEERVAILDAVLGNQRFRTWERTGVIEYVSAGGAAMLTVLGLLKGPSAPLEEAVGGP